MLTIPIVLCCSICINGVEIVCDDDECFDKPCCFVKETAINASDCTISGLQDESVRLFDASRNKNLEFLLIHVGDKFPNLVSYAAERCAITEISRQNFANLFHLRMLNLNRNLIESINIDTFYDLVSLESLMLGKLFFILSFKLQNLKQINILSR